MLCKLNSALIAVSLFALFDVLAPPSALAITAEVAKKCGALSEKAFPPRVVGNPAAGRQNGTFLDFRNYFNKCVANGGNPPEQDDQNQSPNPGAGNQQNQPVQQNKNK